MTNTYPRETVEFQAITVTVDGNPVTTGVKFAVVASGARPTVWADPATVDGKIGVMIDGFAPGTWHAWAQVTDNPETPVVDCGPFIIT